MPSIVSHTVVGLAAGNIFPVKNLPMRFWVLSIICPVLPDADSIAFSFGIPYGHFFGHRGFFHSLFFAFILALFVVGAFFREQRFFSKRWLLFVLYFSKVQQNCQSILEEPNKRQNVPFYLVGLFLRICLDYQK